VVDQYAAGRSLRQIAELTDRSFSAIRSILDRAGVGRRDSGAPKTTARPRRRRSITPDLPRLSTIGGQYAVTQPCDGVCLARAFDL
jgi:hypothetical protein